MHKHKQCKHEMRYCDTCDTAFCGICEKEWSVQTEATTRNICTTDGSNWVTYRG